MKAQLVLTDLDGNGHLIFFSDGKVGAACESGWALYGEEGNIVEQEWGQGGRTEYYNSFERGDGEVIIVPEHTKGTESPFSKIVTYLAGGGTVK